MQGLLNKLKFKIKHRNDIILEDFDKNFSRNDKIIIKRNRKVNKVISRLLIERPEIDSFVPDPTEELNDIFDILYDQTKSEVLSNNFSKTVVDVKILAANYMGTDNGKTEPEIALSCKLLVDMIDCLKFNFLAYINTETDYFAVYKNNSFYVPKSEYVKKVLEMFNFLIEQIIKMTKGICDNNRNEVFDVYQEISNKDNYILDNYKQNSNLDVDKDSKKDDLKERIKQKLLQGQVEQGLDL